MDPHLIELPRLIIIGNNVLEKLPEVCRELGAGKDVLVLCDSNTKAIAGEKASQSMGNAAIDIVADSSSAEVDRIAAGHKPSLIAAAGGGKVIDVAKMVAYRREIPFISIPTAPSHDGIASERASISGIDGNKYSLRAKPPAAIMADIGILSSAPYRLIASGAADVISNYTAVKDWRLAHKAGGEYYSEYAASLSMLSSKIVIKSAQMIRALEERGMRNLVEALVSSGISMSMAGSSRPASGSEHSFSHALDAALSKPENASGARPGLHGEQCGLGSILMACHQGIDWELVRDSLKLLGAPTTAEELGLSSEHVIRALVEARGVRKRFTILDARPLDRKKAEALCGKTGVC